MTRKKGLRRVCDHEPGIRRERRGDAFVYLDEQGDEVTDPEILARIRSLAIPPAYTDVWICTCPDGHIQATARDARGRKQYRYHPEWRCQRDESKFGRMAAFGRALPAIRVRVAKDIRLPGMPRAKVLATIVRLLEITLIRVGNDDYARTNKSYGLTTLKDRHVAIQGANISFSFKGKSGVKHRLSVRDKTLARIVQRARDLPGQELFQYLDSQGRIRDVTSADVNAYLRSCTNGDFTAKDFRTWAGTVLCFSELCGLEPAPSLSRGKREVNQAVERVAGRLGNTPSVCRKSYIHPMIISAYLDGALAEWRKANGQEFQAENPLGLGGEEWKLLSFLEESCLG